MYEQDLEGRYTVSYVGESGWRSPGNTYHAQSWDPGASVLGLLWEFACPALVGEPEWLGQWFDEDGNGYVWYLVRYSGGTFWLSGEGPWGNEETEYTGILDYYYERKAMHYWHGIPLELETWEDPLGTELISNIRPLADSLVQKYLDFLAVLPYPIRVGEHTNTAFGLSFAWDYPDGMVLEGLKELIERRARVFYLEDRACPLKWEPGGFDFLSPCLMEADLMARILGGNEYRDWLQEFLPGILDPESFNLAPAVVTDRSDPKIVHLDGLNLSRAWCLSHISERLDGAFPHLEEMALEHLNASLPYIASGNYEGEHWLASFAVYMLSVGGVEKR